MGWVQHTTVGRGMWHSEIYNRPDEPMRFIQRWFFPTTHGLEPSVEQKKNEKADRMNKFLPIVSNSHPGALRIVSDAAVYSCFIEKRKKIDYRLQASRGAYIYVLEGGPVEVNEIRIPELGAAIIKEGAELLLVEVLLT